MAAAEGTQGVVGSSSRGILGPRASVVSYSGRGEVGTLGRCWAESVLI